MHAHPLLVRTAGAVALVLAISVLFVIAPDSANASVGLMPAVAPEPAEASALGTYVLLIGVTLVAFGMLTLLCGTRPRRGRRRIAA